MKAITLWQPYASLVAVAKPHETRGWPTSYRGPIAIHAAAKAPVDTLRALPQAVIDAMGMALSSTPGTGHYGAKDLLELPRGVIVATANLTECWKVIQHTPTAIILKQSNGIWEDKIPIDAPYLMFGDYSVGRYIFGLAERRALPTPIPAKGKQGLWNWDVSL